MELSPAPTHYSIASDGSPDQQQEHKRSMHLWSIWTGLVNTCLKQTASRLRRFSITRLAPLLLQHATAILNYRSGQELQEAMILYKYIVGWQAAVQLKHPSWAQPGIEKMCDQGWQPEDRI